MQAQAPSMIRPALISGVAFGIAGAIPFVNMLNCACCALIIGCGFVAAYLQAQQCKNVGAAFLPNHGAQVGLLSGLIYGAVTTVVSSLINLVFGFGDWQDIVGQMEEIGTLDPEVMDQMTRFMESTGPSVMVLMGLFISLLFGAIFATVGGLIGGSVFKVEAPDEPPFMGSDAPPPPPVQPGL
jgi:hypothetical protein